MGYAILRGRDCTENRRKDRRRCRSDGREAVHSERSTEYEVRVRHVFGVFGVLRFPGFPLLHCLSARQHVNTKYVVRSVITRVPSKDLLFVFSPLFPILGRWENVQP